MCPIICLINARAGASQQKAPIRMSNFCPKWCNPSFKSVFNSSNKSRRYDLTLSGFPSPQCKVTRNSLSWQLIMRQTIGQNCMRLLLQSGKPSILNWRISTISFLSAFINFFLIPSINPRWTNELLLHWTPLFNLGKSRTFVFIIVLASLGMLCPKSRKSFEIAETVVREQLVLIFICATL